MIDEKGRIFGKINVFDLLVIITLSLFFMIVSTIGYYGFQAFRHKNKTKTVPKIERSFIPGPITTDLEFESNIAESGEQINRMELKEKVRFETNVSDEIKRLRIRSEALKRYKKGD